MLTKCMKQSRSKGFTLTEVVLAIGVVAVLIVGVHGHVHSSQKDGSVRSDHPRSEPHRPRPDGGTWRASQFRACRSQCQKVFHHQICSAFDRRFTGCSLRPSPLRPFLFLQLQGGSDQGRPQDGTSPGWRKGQERPGQNTAVVTEFATGEQRDRWDDFKAPVTPSSPCA